MSETTYDRIGSGYGPNRRADSRIAALIDAALGDAASVVNVGAGTGSYEPVGREVVAVEPSETMISQRPPDAAPVFRAGAEALPFDDDSFDAGLAVLTAHHWPDLDRGVAEMLRVVRRRIVMVAFDTDALADLWISADYFPEILSLKRPDGADSQGLARRLPNPMVTPIPVPRDCTDLFFAAVWARPELLLDESVVSPMWVWQSISDSAREAGRARLASDLESGAWDQRYGFLRGKAELDVGLRLVSSDLPGRTSATP